MALLAPPVLARIVRICVAGVVLAAMSACGGNGASAHTSATNINASLLPAAVSTPAPGLTTPPKSSTPLLDATPVPRVATTTAPDGSVTVTGAPAHVQLTFSIPTSSSVPAAAFRQQQALFRQLQYISASNAGVKVTVTPVGGSASTYTGNCTSGSCTVNFTANPGPNTITIALTDTANGAGTTLSTYTTTTIVQPNMLNTLSFSASPVVDHVALTLASTVVNAGTAANVALTVNAMDAHGNTIVGPSMYVDANGNPVSLLLSVTNSQAGGRGNVSIQGPLRVVSPNQSAIYAHYDGNWLDHATISIAATSAIAGSLTGTILTTVPTVTEYTYVANTGGHTMTGGPDGIVQGADGNLWVSEYTGCMLKVATSGTMNEYCAGANGSYYDTLGSDGNIWYAAEYVGKVGRITPSGSFQNFTDPSISGPFAITGGTDGSIWYLNTGTQAIGRIARNGSIASYPVSFNCLRGIGVGPDGNIWFIGCGSSTFGRLTPQGTETDFSYAGGCSSNGQDNVITGPDGDLWFGGCNGQSIVRATTSGATTIFSSGITAGADVRLLVVGADKNIWFTEDNTATIARITPSGIVTEYPGLMAAGSRPIGITVGQDGNIWFAEFAANKVAKFVY